MKAAAVEGSFSSGVFGRWTGDDSRDDDDPKAERLMNSSIEGECGLGRKEEEC